MEIFSIFGLSANQGKVITNSFESLEILPQVELSLRGPGSLFNQFRFDSNIRNPSVKTFITCKKYWNGRSEKSPAERFEPTCKNSELQVEFSKNENHPGAATLMMFYDFTANSKPETFERQIVRFTTTYSILNLRFNETSV
jgi:hypothetical protein